MKNPPQKFYAVRMKRDGYFKSYYPIQFYGLLGTRFAPIYLTKEAAKKACRWNDEVIEITIKTVKVVK